MWPIWLEGNSTLALAALAWSNSGRSGLDRSDLLANLAPEPAAVDNLRARKMATGLRGLAPYVGGQADLIIAYGAGRSHYDGGDREHGPACFTGPWAPTSRCVGPRMLPTGC